MTTFTQRLNTALAMRGMKAAELAKISGLTEGAISQYRNGVHQANPHNLSLLAKALNVPIPWLMGANVPSPFTKAELDIAKRLRDLIRDANASDLTFDGTPLDRVSRKMVTSSLSNTLDLLAMHKSDGELA